MADEPTTDVVLTDAERKALSDVVFPLHFADPDLDAVAEAVERIIAARVAAACAVTESRRVLGVTKAEAAGIAALKEADRG